MNKILAATIVVAFLTPAAAFAHYQVGGKGDPALQLSEAQQRQAISLARGFANANFQPVPDTFDGKATANLDDFSRWASEVRAQRDVIAATLVALDTPGMVGLASADEIARLKTSLTAALANRDGWLDKALPAYMDQLKKNAEAKRVADSMPQMSPAGPPQPPGAPQIYKDPAYMIAVDGLFPESLGAGLTAGDIPLRPGMGLRSPIPAEVGGKLLGKSVAVLDILQFGYSAGGWMGNEVIIKGQMYENYQKQQAYEEAYKNFEKQKEEWNNGGRGRKEWEQWQSDLRAQRRAAQAQQMQILSSLYLGRLSTWRPPPPPLPPPPPKPVAVDDVPRRVILFNNSAIRCHQPQSNDTNFKLSDFNLRGFDGQRGFDGPRNSNTKIDPELLKFLMEQKQAPVGWKRN